MTVGSKEHYEMIENFENIFNHLRLDKEDKSLWKDGNIYQNGEANNLFRAYSAGYSLGRVNYIN